MLKRFPRDVFRLPLRSSASQSWVAIFAIFDAKARTENSIIAKVNRMLSRMFIEIQIIRQA